jgi:rubrerythrin
MFRHYDFAMATRENALAAFAGESQAHIRYSAFSEKAVEAHYPVIATLFKAIAEAEAIHAQHFLAVLGEVRSTKKNLEAGIHAKAQEAAVTYPAYLKIAHKEKKAEAWIVFSYSIKADEEHVALFSKALAAVTEGHDLTPSSVYLCPVCGSIAIGQPPSRCPVCSVFAKKFIRIL